MLCLLALVFSSVCLEAADVTYCIVGTDQDKTSPQPHYRDNGDGTISDLNTGLMWVKERGEKLTYDRLADAAKECRVGDHDDWRVPTIKELYSLIIFSGANGRGADDVASYKPFIDTKYFGFAHGDESKGERYIDAQDWSATPELASGETNRPRIFGVNFIDGRIKSYPKFSPRNPEQAHTMYVRFVRDNPDYGKNRFAEKKGLISDKSTGLCWSKSDSQSPLSFAEAEAYVKEANAKKYLGFSDWRLPTAKELHSIVDYTRTPDTTKSAAIDKCFDVTSIENEVKQQDFPCFWTSSRLKTGPRFAHIYIAFGRAMGFMRGAWRDVHGAGAQRSDPAKVEPGQYPQGRGPQGDAVRTGHFVRLVRTDSK